MEERRDHVRAALSGSVTFEMSESLSEEFSFLRKEEMETPLMSVRADFLY